MARDSMVLMLAALCMLPVARCAQPNIIYMWSDDMGWGDVSWADYPEIPTPNLQELKEGGTEMMQFYTQPKCTPSRAALMTAKYPFRYGAQTKDVFVRGQNSTLPPDLKLLPAYLKDLGYHTHMVGKWHLGFCNHESIPTSRGFDSFFGSWVNTMDYYHHDNRGYDWNLNDKPYWAANGTYNTHLITQRTQQLLEDHYASNDTADTPLFLYVAYLAPHKPAMVPAKYVEETDCRHIEDDLRRTYCGMVSAMDESVGNIIGTLKKLNKLKDFIIIFSNDNGGALNVHASNGPLRGTKQTVYEGGTRVRTIFHAPRYLSKAPSEYHGLCHVTDVLPTLYQAAGGRLSDLPDDLDGISFWRQLKKGEPSRRKWMVYNMDSSRKLFAYRLKNSTHDFKLVYHDNDRNAGHFTEQGDPEVVDSLSKRYPAPEDRYRLFNLATNPNEYEPSDKYPDAAEQFPEVKKLLKRRMNRLWSEEVEKPLWVEISSSDPGHPDSNNGAWGPGNC